MMFINQGLILMVIIYSHLKTVKPDHITHKTLTKAINNDILETTLRNFKKITVNGNAVTQSVLQHYFSTLAFLRPSKIQLLHRPTYVKPTVDHDETINKQFEEFDQMKNKIFELNEQIEVITTVGDQSATSTQTLILILCVGLLFVSCFVFLGWRMRSSTNKNEFDSNMDPQLDIRWSGDQIVVVKVEF